jgi:hypothetical protein
MRYTYRENICLLIYDILHNDLRKHVNETININQYIKYELIDYLFYCNQKVCYIYYYE